MERTVQPSPGLKIRIWVGERPDAIGHETGTVRGSVAASPSQMTNARSATVEMLRASVDPSSYGLLGATFEPNQGNQLVIEVMHSERPGAPCPWALAKYPRDDVRVGLIPEYAQCVVDAVLSDERHQLLGSGVLRFDVSASSAIRSSCRMFSWLARKTLRLLETEIDLEQATDDQVVDVVRLG